MTHATNPPTPPEQSSEFIGQAVRSFDQGSALLNRPAGVSCPACQSELVVGDLASCKFAGCPSCKGMLFQQDVFAMLIQHLRASSPEPATMPVPLDSEQLDVRRFCPTCETKMETHAYGGPGNAVIDTCFQCQVIWFDNGELTKLVEAPGKR